MKTLLAALIKLQNDGPKDPELGICQVTVTGLDVSKLRELFIQWPKYSGRMVYPVPPEGTLDHHPMDAFNHTPNLWEDTEYGNNRRELLAFCIEKLKQESTQPKS